MACKIEGCTSPGSKQQNGTQVFTNGYCIKHYQRIRRNGDPNIVKCIMGRNRQKHPLYNTYRLMYFRCYGKKCKDYKNYGARGIKMCETWLGDNGFEQFIIDMGNKIEGTTLDRKDNDKGYSKENCRWVDYYTQSANRRNTNKVSGVCFANGIKKYLAYLYFDKKNINLGRFNNYEEAVKARKDAELKYLPHLSIHSPQSS